MHKANRRCFWINNVNRATVSDVNAEGDTALIGNDAIARGEFTSINSAEDSGHDSVVDKGNVVSVDLFCGEQRPIAKAGCVANFPMCGIEPLQRFGFIVGDVDVGNSLDESMTTAFDRVQRGKLFEG